MSVGFPAYCALNSGAISAQGGCGRFVFKTTVRGTAKFMSESVVEPVLKFGAFTAGVGGVVRELLGLRRSLRAASKGQDIKPSKE